MCLAMLARMAKTRCPFCLGDGKRSKEHLFSKPICAAAGLNRSNLIASVDARTGAVDSVVPIREVAVRLPCVDCNNGWMNDLEHDAARVLRRWMARPDHRLSNTGLVFLTRWLVKTSVVLAFGALNARQFMHVPTESAIPDITAAREVAAGHVPDHVYVGAARIVGARTYWGAGNPTVRGTGADLISSRAVNVAAFNLGLLQLWVALPVVPPDRLTPPRGVTRLNARLRSGALRNRIADVDPTQLTVDYSKARAEAVLDALAKVESLTANAGG